MRRSGLVGLTILSVACFGIRAPSALADCPDCRHQTHHDCGRCYDVRVYRYVDKPDVFRSELRPKFAYGITFHRSRNPASCTCGQRSRNWRRQP